jgi:hypothetical protein
MGGSLFPSPHSLYTHPLVESCLGRPDSSHTVASSDGTGGGGGTDTSQTYL